MKWTLLYLLLAVFTSEANQEESFHALSNQAEKTTGSPTLDCSCDLLYGTTHLCENFDALNPGAITPQRMSDWLAVSGDGLVTSDRAFDGSQSLQAPAGSNFALRLGDRAEGVFRLSFQVWAGFGQSASFQLHEIESLDQEALSIHMENGIGTVSNSQTDATLTTFNYSSSTWTKLTFIINIDYSTIALSVNGTDYDTYYFFDYGFDFFSQLGALQCISAGDFYLDAICFAETGTENCDQDDCRVTIEGVYGSLSRCSASEKGYTSDEWQELLQIDEENTDAATLSLFDCSGNSYTDRTLPDGFFANLVPDSESVQEGCYNVTYATWYLSHRNINSAYATYKVVTRRVQCDSNSEPTRFDYLTITGDGLLNFTSGDQIKPDGTGQFPIIKVASCAAAESLGFEVEGVGCNAQRRRGTTTRRGRRRFARKAPAQNDDPCWVEEIEVEVEACDIITTMLTLHIYSDLPSLPESFPTVELSSEEELDGLQGSVQQQYLDILAADCSHPYIATYQDEELSPENCKEQLLRTWTVADSCGNTATIEQRILFPDAEAPTFTAPPDITLDDSSMLTDTSLTGGVRDASDNFQVAEITYTDNLDNFDGCSGTVLRTWIVRDPCGNENTDEQEITIEGLLEIDESMTNEFGLVLRDCDGNQLSCEDLPANLKCEYFQDETPFQDSCYDVSSARWELLNMDNGALIDSYDFEIRELCFDPEFPTIESITINPEGFPSMSSFDDFILESDFNGNQYATIELASCTIADAITDDSFIINGAGCNGTFRRGRVARRGRRRRFSRSGPPQMKAPCWMEEIVVGVRACSDYAEATLTLLIYSDLPPLPDTLPPALLSSREELPDVENEVQSYLDGLAADCSHPYIPSYQDQELPPEACSEQLLRTWTVADSCGNTAAIEQRILFPDTEAPTFTAPPDITIDDVSILTDTSVTGGVRDVQDICETVTISYADRLVSYDDCSGIIERTWMVGDPLGYQATALQQITITQWPQIDEANTDETTLELTDCAGITYTENTLPAPFSVAFGIDPAPFGQEDCDNLFNAAWTLQYQDTEIDAYSFTAREACDNNSDPTRFDYITITGDGLLNIPSGSPIELDANGQFPIIEVASCAAANALDENSFVIEGIGCNAQARRGAIARRSRRRGLINKSPAHSEAPCWIEEIDIEVAVCGGFAEATLTLHIYSDLPPLPDTLLPALLSSRVELPGVENEVQSYLDGLAADCSHPYIAFYEDQELPPEACSEQLLRTWTVTDSCGNLDTLPQRIVFPDEEAPTFTVPPPAEVARVADADSLHRVGRVDDATDNCRLDTLFYLDDRSGLDDCPGILRRTWVAIDEAGNRTEQRQDITIVTPTTITGFAEGSLPFDYGATVAGGTRQATIAVAAAAAAFDASSFQPTDLLVESCAAYEVAVSYTLPTPDAPCYSFDVEYRLLIAGAEADRFVVQVQVICSEAPAIQEIIVGGEGLLNYSDGDPVGEGAVIEVASCDAAETIYFQVEGGSCDFRNSGFYTLVERRSLPAGTGPCFEDVYRLELEQCGEVTADTVYVHIFSELPTVLPPIMADLTVGCREELLPLEDSLAAEVAAAATGCSLPLLTIRDATPDGEGCGATFRRTWLISDDCGQRDSVEQLITILDREAPTFTPPADFLLETAAALADTSLTGSVRDAADNCQLAGITYSDDPSAFDGCSGIVDRTWTVQDFCGNTSQAVQRITVLPDETPPAFEPPPAAVLNCPDELADPTLTGTVQAVTDNRGVADTTFTDTPLAAGCAGTILRTWTVTDYCGNEAMATQTIEIRDEELPVVLAPEDLTLECLAARDDLGVTGTLLFASDNCGIRDTTFTDNLTRLSDCAYRLERTWTVTDLCGNVQSDVQVIRISDQEPPRFVAPPNVRVPHQEKDNLVLTGTVREVQDNCRIRDTSYIDQVLAEVSCEQEGWIIRIWTVTDDCGLTTRATQEIFTYLESADTEVALDSLPTLCADDTPLLLTAGNPAGGRYSGPGIDEGRFDPAVAGPGQHRISYIYGEEECVDTAQALIEVVALPELMTGPVPAICSDTMPFQPNFIQPAGGRYAGPGISDGLFNPAAVGAGAYQLTYTLENEQGCVAATTFELKVETCSTPVGRITKEVTMQLFPNPSSGAFQLVVSGWQDKTAEVSVYDQHGRLVFHRALVPTAQRLSEPLSMAAYPSGVYWVTVQGESFYQVQRLVLIR